LYVVYKNGGPKGLTGLAARADNKTSNQVLRN
jgi:hypothetical protein